MAPQERLVVALDFGTTFTGIAFAYSGTPDEVEVIKTWPHGGGITSEKVPSELSYEGSVPSRSSEFAAAETSSFAIDRLASGRAKLKIIESIRWGFGLRPDDERVKGLKLFLDRDIKLPSFVSAPDLVNQLRDANRSVIDAIADYLHKIRIHANEILSKRFGEAFMNSTTVEYVVTVPAVWSDKAKDATFQAVRRAGFSGPISMLTEPEAAAIHTMKVIRPNSLKIGEHIVVCDAGGGTVDLITYRITQLSPSVQVEESQTGTGGLCGSAFLNLRFEDFVSSKLGEAMFSTLKRTKPKAWHVASKTFEAEVKRTFDGEDPEQADINIPFPGADDNENANIHDGFLTITHEEMKKVFEPVVAGVLSLIEQQVGKLHADGELASAIILVGGFGQSEYLYKRVKKHFENNFPPSYAELDHQLQSERVLPPALENRPISVMQPQSAWTSVVRGAVIRGLEGSIVTQRRARYNYGFRYRTTYYPEFHPIQYREWDDLEGEWKTRALKWFVRKGDLISTQRAIQFPLFYTFPNNDFTGERRTKLLASTHDNAPFLDSIDEGSAFTCCTVAMPLEHIPSTRISQRTGKTGRTYWRVDHVMQLRIDSARLEFEYLIGGENFGSATASFDHEAPLV